MCENCAWTIFDVYVWGMYSLNTLVPCLACPLPFKRALQAQLNCVGCRRTTKVCPTDGMLMHPWSWTLQLLSSTSHLTFKQLSSNPYLPPSFYFHPLGQTFKKLDLYCTCTHGLHIWQPFRFSLWISFPFSFSIPFPAFSVVLIGRGQAGAITSTLWQSFH
jgi:ferredoxin